jgi:STE24 endopeptidase
MGTNQARQTGGFLMKVLLAIALVLSVTYVVSGLLPRIFSQKAIDYFGPAFLESVSRRARFSYAAAGLESIAAFLTLFAFAVGTFQKPLFAGIPVTEHVSPGKGFWIGTVLALQAGLLLTVVSMPFRWFRGYYLEKAFGLSRLTLGGWFWEFAKGSVLNFAIYAVTGGTAAFLLARFPRTWQYVLTLALFFGSIFFAYVYPTAIAPVFDRFVPLKDQSLLSEVSELAGKAGMQVEKVLVMEASRKTARANAYFTGIGNSKQVVLYDNLIANYSIEEIRLVLAHELGHWKYGHIAKGIGFSVAGTLIITMLFSLICAPLPDRFSVANLRSVFLSLVLFSILASYVATPAASILSRRHEVQADMFSLELTGDSNSFIAAMAGLARSNLGDVEPPPFIRWFAWTHPTTIERITMGEQWK